MSNPKILEEVSSKISAFLAASPARDIEKNVKAMLSASLAKLDLVTREEFDVQCEVLARARQKLGELEARIAQLETELAKGRTGGGQ